MYVAMVTVMKFILAKKGSMVSFVGTDGRATAATLLTVEPAIITQVKSKATDGYEAVQVGAGTRSVKNISKAVQGHTKDLGSFAVIREFRVVDSSAWKKGDTLDVAVLAEGDIVEVSGTSKGKGFQGVVKRHGFHGGPRTHGQKHSEREGGSIGGGLRTHVPKGMRMAGRMGGDRITQKNLEVVSIDKENNLMLVKGAITGKRGSLVEVVSR